MKKLKPIMFVGTGSDVGKSVVNAGFCRIFKQDGYAPAPFKAQNMSLNSYPTPDNLEIGRAQAVQAEAAGVECSVLMNPLLLKPISNCSSQVILHGRPIGNRSAVEYFRQDNRDELFVEVQGAFDTLTSQFNPIVMEGAGSISEMNLWRNDITNMRMAQYADAVTILVADIDRGGVFASVYGSVMLLPEEQRRLIKGVIVNKFRGDISLFDQGRDIIEQITGVPVVGVLPYFKDIFIEQEDSVSLDYVATRTADESAINIAIVRLPSISNFTDFNTLSMCKGVEVSYVQSAQEIEQADIVILPGSKSTISDLLYMRKMALDGAILKHHKAGKPLYGICGGYQMMGEMVYDPDLIEGDVVQVAGLGVIPTSTVIKGGKVTRQCRFQMVGSDIEGEGYEIHSGETVSDSPLVVMDNGEEDGYFKSEKCWGSYIHGIFDNRGVIASILSTVGGDAAEVEDYRAMKERNYDLLADALRERVDMEYIYKLMSDD
ncbi:MAG: cobyric acid synthase [Rikenellaceae bacterium]